MLVTKQTFKVPNLLQKGYYYNGAPSRSVDEDDHTLSDLTVLAGSPLSRTTPAVRKKALVQYPGLHNYAQNLNNRFSTTQAELRMNEGRFIFSKDHKP